MLQEYKPKARVRARERLNEWIIACGLQAGQRLPSERTLCQSWQLSRSAVRSALEQMEKEGLVYTRPGAGTYLAPPKYSRNLQGLLSLSQSAGQQLRSVTTHTLELRQVECDKSLAGHFKKTLGYRLYKLARLRVLDSIPLMLETAFLPAENVDNLEQWDLEKDSLFAILEEQYGAVPSCGEEKIGITYATADEAELMEVAEGTPLFWIVSHTYDQHGQLLEYCRAVARPDRLKFISELKRRGTNSKEVTEYAQ